jgi:hypothetical protein
MCWEGQNIQRIEVVAPKEEEWKAVCLLWGRNRNFNIFAHTQPSMRYPYFVTVQNSTKLTIQPKVLEFPPLLHTQNIPLTTSPYLLWRSGCRILQPVYVYQKDKRALSRNLWSTILFAPPPFPVSVPPRSFPHNYIIIPRALPPVTTPTVWRHTLLTKVHKTTHHPPTDILLTPRLVSIPWVLRTTVYKTGGPVIDLIRPPPPPRYLRGNRKINSFVRLWADCRRTYVPRNNRCLGKPFILICETGRPLHLILFWAGWIQSAPSRCPCNVRLRLSLSSRLLHRTSVLDFWSVHCINLSCLSWVLRPCFLARGAQMPTL